MKKISVLFLVFISMSCGAPKKEEANQETIKDLGEIMIDLKAYHQNIGDYLVRGQLKETEWLVDGMDSTLHLAIVKFVEHPKLAGSFESFYDKLLEKSIIDLKASIKSNNHELAIENFTALTNNCNSCHKKHKVDKRAKFNP